MTITEQVSAFVAEAKDLAKDGLTVGEFARLTVSLLYLVVGAIESIPADGVEKKAWAIAAAASLFDAVADRCIPLYFMPFWVVARPTIRAIVLAAAGGVVESLLPIVRGAK